MPAEGLQISIQNGKFSTRVLKAGAGEPLLYLHGIVGQKGWAPFLDSLSQQFTVYAPFHPGCGESEGLENVDSVLDLTLYYFELMDSLGLEQCHVVGHSFGGMIAAEMAAICHHRIKGLVLAAAAGLWLDNSPSADFLAMTTEEMNAHIWSDLDSAVARQAMAQPESDEARRELMIDRIKDLTAAGKFLTPLPDRGLKKRLYRIKSPTLILWGEKDKMIPPAYADEFSRHISGARLEVLPRWGHLPMLEQPEEFVSLAVDFLKS